MGKKSSAPPPAPDYAALTKLSAAEQAQLIDKQTAANRPDQVTPWGRSTWGQDASGKWTETQTLNPVEQAQLDSQRSVQSGFDTTARGLLGQVQDSMGTPLSFDGLPELKNYDFSKLYGGESGMDPGFGAVKEVQDAMMSRLKPGRDQAREAEIQRLRNQGITDNSEAFQRALTRLDQGDTDASNQALLGATDAYGDIFDRGMALRSQQFGQQGADISTRGTGRQQMLAEREMQRQSPLNDLMKLQGQDVSSPNMPSFVQAGTSQAPDYMGAGQAQYGAAMDGYNARQSRRGGLMSGLFGLAGSALGGPIGGQLSGWIGSKF